MLAVKLCKEGKLSLTTLSTLVVTAFLLDSFSQFQTCIYAFEWDYLGKYHEY